jgi:hypothetical protein
MKKIIFVSIPFMFLFLLSNCSSMPPTDCYHMQIVEDHTPEGEVCFCRCWYTDDPIAEGSLCHEDCDPGCYGLCF